MPCDDAFAESFDYEALKRGEFLADRERRSRQFFGKREPHGAARRRVLHKVLPCGDALNFKLSLNALDRRRKLRRKRRDSRSALASANLLRFARSDRCIDWNGLERVGPIVEQQQDLIRVSRDCATRWPSLTARRLCSQTSRRRNRRDDDPEQLANADYFPENDKTKCGELSQPGLAFGLLR